MGAVCAALQNGTKYGTIRPYTEIEEKQKRGKPMTYRLLALDIDGTLRAAGEPRVLRRTAEAVRAVQKQGVLVAVATGRGRGGIPAGMLRGIRPD